MSALAHLCLEAGDVVSGSDSAASPLTEALAAAGAHVTMGHSEEALGSEGPDLVVASTAIRPDNPELRAARRRGIRVISRGRAVAEVAGDRRQVAIAGTHGKTTTTTMTAAVLAVLDPMVISGGTLPGTIYNSSAGSGMLAVIEADESDGAFLELLPEVAVVTNLEADHLDRYSGVGEIRRAFEAFTSRVTSTLVACIDDPGARALLAVAPTDTLSYGFDSSAEVMASDYQATGGGSGFDLSTPWGIAKVELRVPGRHNAANALGAAAVGLRLGRPLSEVVGALGQVALPGRRLELVGNVGGARVYDDYGHHPTEVAATLGAARELGGGRLVCAFQPHMYTRLEAFMGDFARSLALADEVLLLPVYAARDEPIPGIDSAALASAIRVLEGAPPVALVASVDELAGELRRRLGAGDVAVCMGAGDINRATRELRDGAGSAPSPKAPR